VSTTGGGAAACQNASFVAFAIYQCGFTLPSATPTQTPSPGLTLLAGSAAAGYVAYLYCGSATSDIVLVTAWLCVTR
jgi:hypothetical protein